jgi:hypothetical protein
LSSETSSLRILSQALTKFLNERHREEARRRKREDEEGELELLGCGGGDTMDPQESRELVLQSLTQTSVFKGLFGPEPSSDMVLQSLTQTSGFKGLFEPEPKSDSKQSAVVKFKENDIDET